MKQNFTNIPTGVLDTDSDLTQVSPENFIASLNMRQHPGEKIRRNIKGNAIVPYTQPAGINETAGQVEDKYLASSIEFVKNSLGNDQIRRFWSLEDRYELLLEHDMDLNNKISEAGVIDGRHLFWTDFNGSSGNEPRYLDMEYISLYQKQLCYELYWDSASFNAAEEYTIEIVDIDGTVILPEEVFYTAVGGDPDQDADDLAAALTGYDVTVDFCGNKIIICAGTQEQRIRIAGQGIHFSPTNHYPETIIDKYIALARMMPKQPPAPRFVADSSLSKNRLWGFTFQFRYRYVYWNGVKSKWSPISYVPTNFIDDGLTPNTVENSDLYNKMVISFDDEILDSQDWKAFVRRVEVAVRYEQTGPWKLVGAFDVADLGVAIHELEFLNDGSYQEIASDEISEGTVQALGNQDFVPRYCRTMEIIQDEVGRHLLSLGGSIEQYDQVDCVDATIEARLGFYEPAPTTTTDQTTTCRTFKVGGVFGVYVIYEDDFGRQWPAKKIGTYQPVNGLTAEWIPGVNFPRITINHIPPIEATRFRIAFSPNQNQGTYIQLVSYAQGTYWKKTPDPVGGEGTFTSTTFTAGDADLVGFVFDVNDLDENQINFIFNDDYDSGSLVVQPGDRLHIINEAEDYPVEGYNLTSPSGLAVEGLYFVFIKFVPGMPDYTPPPFDSHLNIELYRPLNSNMNLVYEIGEAYDIVDAGLPTRNHGSFIDIEGRGDTFNYSYRDNSTQIDFFERPNLYLFKKEVGSDFGRPNAEDADFREVDSYDQIRLSDFYVPQTGINGFHSFRGTNSIRTRRDYGALQSLQFCAGELLAIGQFGTQPIYVSKDRLMTLDGATVGRSSRILNIGPELSRMRGTHSPASIVNTGQYVYGFDEYRGIPWRWSHGGGIDDINIGNIELFRSLGRDLLRDSYTTIGGYQEEFDTYFLTFGQLRTMGFSEKRGWEGDFSFIPECYGNVGLRFFSFKDGNAWEHEAENYCTFFGLDYDAYTVMAVNPEPQAVKLFWNFRVQGSKPWMPFVSIPAGITPVGMETRILAAKFMKKEGQWKVDIPRDGRDPAFAAISPPGTRYITSILKGRRMRGEVMTAWVQADDPQAEFIIRRLDTEWSPSMETK